MGLGLLIHWFRHLRLTAQQAQVLLVLCLISTLLWLISVVPPFQSPDEVDHLKRAYLLSQGVLVLQSSTVTISEQKIVGSGGMIDRGLLRYMDHHFQFAAKPEMKRKAEEEKAVKSIMWEGEKILSLTPGTAYYFPLIYAPQALALSLGKQLDLSVDQSYLLARYLVVLSIGLLLLLACYLYPLPIAAIALLGLPMTLFQMSTTSLDGITFALAVVCVAGFMRMTSDNQNLCASFFAAWCLALFLLLCSRIHMLPMFLLLAFACWKSRKPIHTFSATATVVAVIVWLYVASQSALDPRVNLGLTTSELAKIYLFEPLKFIHVLAYTLWDVERISFYWRSFIGILGWLDTPLQNTHYMGLTMLLLLTWGLSSFTTLTWTNLTARLGLVMASVLSILLIFFALLITWTPHPAQLVEGIQGRYFLIPALLLGYATSPRTRTNDVKVSSLTLTSLVFFLGYSIWCLQQTLMIRYPAIST